MVRDSSYFVRPENKVDTEMAGSLWTSPFLWDCMLARSKHPVSSHPFPIHCLVSALAPLSNHPFLFVLLLLTHKMGA